VTVTRSLALFVLAALAEIGGAWLVWQGWREHRGVVWIAAGVAALAAYGFVATFQPDSHFGRILAAYGGVFVAGSLAWGVVMDGFRPDAGTSPARRSAWRRGDHHVRAPRLTESMPGEAAVRYPGGRVVGVGSADGGVQRAVVCVASEGVQPVCKFVRENGLVAAVRR
jgi:small multidrug resistance family-3 protein